MGASSELWRTQSGGGRFSVSQKGVLMKELTCNLEESDMDWVPHFIGAETYESPSVFYKNNSIGLHRVRNPHASGNNQAVSLHLYSPPIPQDIAWLDKDGKHWLPNADLLHDP